jgi:hypothetical protein
MEVILPCEEIKSAASVSLVATLTLYHPARPRTPIFVYPPPTMVGAHSFVQVHGGANWLCRLLCNEREKLRPLTRTTLFDALKSALQDARANILAENRSVSQSIGISPSLAGKAKQERKEHKEMLKDHPVISVMVPLSPQSSATTDLVMKNDMVKLFLEVNAKSLDWMIAWVTVEQKKGPLPQPPQSGENAHCDAGKVFFSRRENCWYVRGPLRTKKFSIADKGTSSTPMNFSGHQIAMASMKNAAEEELSRQLLEASAAAVGQGVTVSTPPKKQKAIEPMAVSLAKKPRVVHSLPGKGKRLERTPSNSSEEQFSMGKFDGLVDPF